MKRTRLVLAALAIAATGTWSVYAIACEKTKSATAQATTAGMTKATKSSCAAGAAAMTASAECAAHGAKATMAATAATKSAKAGCGSHDAATFSTASAGQACGAGTSAKSATFTTASATGKSAKTAGADACCATKGAKSARATMAAAGAGACGSGAAMAGVGTCSGQALTMAMCKEAHAGCDACEDMAAFEAELTGAGAAVQAVPIKNGVMFVYTAPANGQVSAVQSAVTRRSDHLHRIVTAGDQSRLCAGCKAMRGAMASGKVVREVVSIEGGSLALVTSSDPKLVRQIRAMADAGKTSARVKS